MSVMEITLLVTLVCLISIILFFFLYFIKTSNSLKSLRGERDYLSGELRRVELEAVEQRVEKESCQKVLDSERRTFFENKDQLQSTFRSLASEALEGNNRQFIELAKQNLEKERLQNKSDWDKRQMVISELVGPLKSSLENYQSQVHEMEKSRQNSYTVIERELKRVVETGVQLSKETTALKDALKKPHVRGRWGEIQLRNCIEIAGISEYSDVSLQDVHQGGESQRLIPDMTVRMPGGRLIVVDAKTPIDAFMASLETDSEQGRREQIAQHAKQVKQHIKQLAAKEYQSHIKNSADFTVMFLPNESFLYAALEGQMDLIEYALEKKVLIATPPTLIGLLRVVRYGWNEQRLAENAERISETGKELHKRISDFLEAYTNVGKSLERAKLEFDTGLKRLQSRVLTQVKRLEDLGAKSYKELPEWSEL